MSSNLIPLLASIGIEPDDPADLAGTDDYDRAPTPAPAAVDDDLAAARTPAIARVAKPEVARAQGQASTALTSALSSIGIPTDAEAAVQGAAGEGAGVGSVPTGGIENESAIEAAWRWATSPIPAVQRAGAGVAEFLGLDPTEAIRAGDVNTAWWKGLGQGFFEEGVPQVLSPLDIATIPVQSITAAKALGRLGRTGEGIRKAARGVEMAGAAGLGAEAIGSAGRAIEHGDLAEAGQAALQGAGAALLGIGGEKLAGVQGIPLSDLASAQALERNLLASGLMKEPGEVLAPRLVDPTRGISAPSIEQILGTTEPRRPSYEEARRRWDEGKLGGDASRRTGIEAIDNQPNRPMTRRGMPADEIAARAAEANRQQAMQEEDAAEAGLLAERVGGISDEELVKRQRFYRGRGYAQSAGAVEAEVARRQAPQPVVAPEPTAPAPPPPAPTPTVATPPVAAASTQAPGVVLNGHPVESYTTEELTLQRSAALKDDTVHSAEVLRLIEPELIRRTKAATAPAPPATAPAPAVADVPGVSRPLGPTSTPESIGRNFLDWATTKTQDAVRMYRERFGHDIGADEAKELSADYAVDKESRASLATIVQKGSQRIARDAYGQIMSEPVPATEDPHVVLLGGGTGAGKSTAKKTPRFMRQAARANATWDGTLSDLDRTRDLINTALVAGRRVDFYHVYRDPVDAWENGVIPRAVKEGRTIPVSQLVDSHLSARDTLFQLASEFADDPRVRFRAIDNSRGPGAAREVDIADLPAIPYTREQLQSLAIEKLEAARARGEISDAAYRASLEGTGTEPRPRPREDVAGVPAAARPSTPVQPGGVVEPGVRVVRGGVERGSVAGARGEAAAGGEAAGAAASAPAPAPAPSPNLPTPPAAAARGPRAPGVVPPVPPPAPPPVERGEARLATAPKTQQPPDELGFFSQLRRAVDSFPQPKASAANWVKYLSDPKRAVKRDELKWTGLDEFLTQRVSSRGQVDRGQDSVTKQEIQEFLDRTEVKVEERVTNPNATETTTIAGHETDAYREAYREWESEYEGWESKRNEHIDWESEHSRWEDKHAEWEGEKAAYDEGFPQWERDHQAITDKLDSSTNRYQLALDNVVRSLVDGGVDADRARRIAIRYVEGGVVSPREAAEVDPLLNRSGGRTSLAEAQQEKARQQEIKEQLDRSEQREPEKPGEEPIEPEEPYFDEDSEPSEPDPDDFDEEVEGEGDSGKFADYSVGGSDSGTNYREVVLTLPRSMKGRVGGRFRHTAHWDDDNPIAHFRLKDRRGVDGKRVLFVEEVQSDWGQQGRDTGFREGVDTKEMEETQRQLDQAYQRYKDHDTRLVGLVNAPDYKGVYGVRYEPEVDADYPWAVFRHDTGTASDGNRWHGEERAVQDADSLNLDYLRRTDKELQILNERYLELRGKYTSLLDKQRGVLRGPFVEETQQWAALAFKRIIRMAAEEGYDRVAWATGAQNANHYNLAKKVRRISWGDSRPKPEKRYELYHPSMGDVERSGSERELAYWNDVFSDRIGRGEVAIREVASEAVAPEAISIELHSDTANNPSLQIVVDSKGTITSVPTNQAGLRETDIVGKPLDDLLGKEIAAQIQGGPSGAIEGDGLRAGGTGMRAFYDRAVVPPVVGKIAGKWGVKVKDTDVVIDSFTYGRDDPGVVKGADGKWISRNQSIDITDAMRKSVETEGFPRFATEKRGAAAPAPAPAPITLDSVRSIPALSRLTFTTSTDGSLTAPLTNGRTLRITPDSGEIVISPKSLAESAQAHGLTPEEAQPIGAFQRVGRDGVVWLSKQGQADSKVVDEEAFHFAWEFALTDQERARALKKYGDEEAAATAYANWTPATVNSWFSKILAFARSVYRAFRPNYESTFQAVRSGEAAGRVAGEPVAAASAPPPVRRPMRRPLVPGAPNLARMLDTAGPARLATGPATPPAPTAPGAPALPIPGAGGLIQTTPRTKAIATGKPPRVEQNVRALRRAESTREQLLDLPSGTAADVEVPGKKLAAPTHLARETRRTWASLDAPIQEILRKRDLDWFVKTAKRRVLDDDESQALDAFVAGKAERLTETRDAWRDLVAKGSAATKSEIAAAHRSYLTSLADYVPAELAYTNDGTGAGRALAARARIMEAANVPDREFLRKVFREIKGIDDGQATALLQMYDAGDPSLPIALSAALHGRLRRWIYAWKAGLVSAPGSHLANASGNTVTQGIEVLDTAASAGVDWALRKLGGQTGQARERTLREAGAELGAMLDAWPESLSGYIRDVGFLFRRVATGEALPLDPSTQLKRQISPVAGWGPVGRAIDVPLHALGAGDKFSKSIVSRGVAAKLATRRAVRELGQNASRQAIETRAQKILADVSQNPHKDENALLIKEVNTYRDRLVFQDRPWDAVSWLDHAAGKWPLIDIVAPFRRTPANIARYALEHTPAGFLPGGKAWKAFGDFKSGKITRGQAADIIAPRIVGSLLMGGFVAAAKMGRMTGSGPVDAREKSLKLDTGWQPYSFVIPIGGGRNLYLPYNRLSEPIASLMATVADYNEIKDETKAGDMIDKALGSVMQNWTDKTYLQGLTDAATVVSRPSQFMSRYASNLAGSLIPNVVAKAAQAIDPKLRQTSATSSGVLGIPETVVKKIASRIPGLTYTLDTRKSGLGEEIARPGVGVTRFALPSQPSVTRPERELESTLLDLGITPSPPSRDFTVPGSGGKRLKLRDEELAVLSQEDKLTTDRLRRYIKAEEFRKLDAEEQRKFVEEAYRKASERGREILLSKPGFRSRALAARKKALAERASERAAESGG